LTTLETSITKLDGRVGHSESEIKSLRKDFGSQIEAIERELVGVRTRLGDVEEGVKDAIDDGRLRAALESFLPSRMPVRYVRGGLEIDPAFWVDLKKTFAGHDDVDRAVRDAVSRAGSGKGTMPDLAAFEERLTARFGREQRDTANKAWFIDTLERELVTLRTSFDEKLRLAKALHATPKSNAKFKTVSNDDLVPFLQDLIDAALLRYSKDTLARADHALHSAGARVIPSITSDTFTVRQPSAFGRWVLGRKPVEGHPPAMALHPERSVGSCWPFEGSEGQLGVLLANRAVVQAVSVEHAPGELVASVASAPKEIEIVSSACT
jgi:SUN domain-containing protein 1/2